MGDFERRPVVIEGANREDWLVVKPKTRPISLSTPMKMATAVKQLDCTFLATLMSEGTADQAYKCKHLMQSRTCFELYASKPLSFYQL